MTAPGEVARGLSLSTRPTHGLWGGGRLLPHPQARQAGWLQSCLPLEGGGSQTANPQSAAPALPAHSCPESQGASLGVLGALLGL